MTRKRIKSQDENITTEDLGNGYTRVRVEGPNSVQRARDFIDTNFDNPAYYQGNLKDVVVEAYAPNSPAAMFNDQLNRQFKMPTASDLQISYKVPHYSPDKVNDTVSDVETERYLHNLEKSGFNFDYANRVLEVDRHASQYNPVNFLYGTGINVLDPSQWVGATSDLITDKTDTNGNRIGFWTSLGQGNSGFVTDKFMKEHPILGPITNMVGGSATIGLGNQVFNLTRPLVQQGYTAAVNTTRSGTQALNNSIQQGKNLVRNFKISRAISKAPFASDYQTYLDTPALQDVGSFQEYRNYLTTIFPESKYPEIAFHGGPKGIKRFRTPTKGKLNKSINTATKDFGIYFTNSEDLGKYYAGKSGQVYRVKLNLPSVIRYDNPAFSQRFIGTDKLRFSPDAISNYWYNRLNLSKYNGIIQNKSGSPFSRGQITMFNPDDIHILGSPEDVTKFSQWKKNPITLETPSYDPQAIPNMSAQYNINLRTVLPYIGGHTPIILGTTLPAAGIDYLWQQIREQKTASKNEKD